MPAAANPSSTGEYTDPPIARIDAQDVSYILPLREFLELYGVQVLVNQDTHGVPLYHLIAGDRDFVRDIFSRAGTTNDKLVGIILAQQSETVDPSGYPGKIVIAGIKPLSADQVRDVFNFLFTGTKNVLDLRDSSVSRISDVHVTRHKNVESAKDEQHVGVRTAREDDRIPDDRARIKRIMEDVFGDKSISKPGDSQKKRSRRHKKIRSWVLAFLFPFCVAFIFCVWYLLSMGMAGVTLVFGVRALSQGNIAAVRWDTRVSSYWIAQGKLVLGAVAMPLSWVGYEDVIRGQERLFSLFSDSAYVLEETQLLAGVASRVAGGLLNQVDVKGSGLTSASDVVQLRTSLYTVQNTLGLAQAELSQLLKDRTFPFTIPFVLHRATDVTRELSTLRGFTTDIDNFLSLFLQLSGFREPRTYLILLQNSMELRPTGGFIGSVAIASFEDGRLTNLDVQDVYTFDGQLKGHVDPPAPIRDLLGQEHWYLRDSNWDPDFQTAAAKAAWFYEKETGNVVDGVFAINTPFITNVLSATGPIELPDYNDRITAENFYGKSLYYTQSDFFPGSTQKKDFLGALSRALLSHITTDTHINMTKLFRAITTSFSAHDIMMMFPDQALASLVAHYGWAGNIPTAPGCRATETEFCRFDPMIAAEANMGVNKVNYFITRDVRRQVNISPDGQMDELQTVTFHNTGESGDKGLPYRVYVQFLLPKNSSVDHVSIDGVLVQSRAIRQTPTVPYIEKTNTSTDFFTLGVALDVPAGARKRIDVSYNTSAPLVFGPSGAVVDLYTQKQPGVEDTPVHTIVRYPSTWTAGIEEQGSGQSQDFIANVGQLEYNTTLTRDALTRIRFTK